jgi:hypothetical protein
MIPLLCWMLLVQRAGIEQYVALTSNMIKWLVCVSRHQEEGPYWIGCNDPETETRDCQCRARIVEAIIMLLHLCYSHVRKSNFQGEWRCSVRSPLAGCLFGQFESILLELQW